MARLSEILRSLVSLSRGCNPGDEGTELGIFRYVIPDMFDAAVRPLPCCYASRARKVYSFVSELGYAVIIGEEPDSAQQIYRRVGLVWVFQPASVKPAAESIKQIVRVLERERVFAAVVGTAIRV
jgi:hypothetical protein